MNHLLLILLISPSIIHGLISPEAWEIGIWMLEFFSTVGGGMILRPYPIVRELDGTLNLRVLPFPQPRTA